MKPFLTIPETADTLHVCENTVRSMVAARKLRTVRFGVRSVRVTRESFLRYQKSEDEDFSMYPVLKVHELF